MLPPPALGAARDWLALERSAPGAGPGRCGVGLWRRRRREAGEVLGGGGGGGRALARGRPRGGGGPGAHTLGGVGGCGDAPSCGLRLGRQRQAPPPQRPRRSRPAAAQPGRPASVGPSARPSVPRPPGPSLGPRERLRPGGVGLGHSPPPVSARAVLSSAEPPRLAGGAASFPLLRVLGSPLPCAPHALFSPPRAGFAQSSRCAAVPARSRRAPQAVLWQPRHRQPPCRCFPPEKSAARPRCLAAGAPRSPCASVPFPRE